MHYESITQQELSDRSKIKRSLISKLLGDAPPKTLSEELLNSLCNCWSEKRAGLIVLEAHLKDEIERSGRSLDEIQPQITGQSLSPILDRDLATIQSFLDKDNDLKSVISMTAETVRQLDKTKKGSEFTQRSSSTTSPSVRRDIPASNSKETERTVEDVWEEIQARKEAEEGSKGRT